MHLSISNTWIRNRLYDDLENMYKLLGYYEYRHYNAET